MKAQEVKKQSEFCKELAVRLNKAVQGTDIDYNMIVGATVIQDDIKRLRRELMTLSRMVGERVEP